MRRLLTAACAVATLLLVTTAAAAESGTPSTTPASAEPERAARIVNGTLTGDYPSTGALLSPANPNTASTVCSGTLIGCQTFLTAGHCVEGNLNPSVYTVFFQHAGFFTVSSIALHPDYDFPEADVAVLTLAATVHGVRPARINTTATPGAGLPGTIVGFGRAGGFTQDYGIKRVGSVTTATCKNGVSNSTSVCWDFKSPLGSPGTNSNTCNGDSGGPLFIDFGAGARVAGVTSGGSVDDCLPTDSSYDTNVFAYRTWIQDQGGADLDNTTCGAAPQVGDAGSSIVALSGALSSTTASASHSFQVMPGTGTLRVSLNAIDDGSDFDLFVKAGSPPSTASFDCRQNGSGQFGFCEFSGPAAGTWYVLVDRAAGSGTYQVTATTLSGGCGDPANNGLACDDLNACTVNDRCQAGNCIGTTAPTGTACDDGDPCTQSDGCQANVCRGSEIPRTDCRDPFVSPSGIFQLQDTTPNASDDSDKLTWSWLRGIATLKTDFGSPPSTTSYDLCVYDESSGIPGLIMSEHVAAAAVCGTKACWKEGTSSFRYTDKKLQNGPIRSLYLKAGDDGKAKITLKAKGTQLGMPHLPLNKQEAVVVQLSNGATCWEGRYSNSTRNDGLEFKAKAD